MIINKFTFALTAFSSLFFASLVQAQKSDYQTDPKTGIKYQFIKHSDKGKRPSEGDVTSVVLVYKTEKDSALFDSRSGKDSTGTITIPLKFPFKGCLEQGIALMSVGDSASFLVSADSLYLKGFKLKALPIYIRPGSTLKFYIKLVSFQTADEIKAARTKQIDKARADLDAMKTDEAKQIKKYISDNKITVKPVFIDSIYFLMRSGKPGRLINDGDSVEVKYKGMLLDGTIFDQSDSVHGQATFKFQYSHQAHLIKGWIEVLASMHEGEKVKVLIPSSLAYGSNKAGEAIKPYAPLLFEIEVVHVKPFN